jgi:hypothetical protein
MSDNIFMELSTHLNLQAHGVQMNTNYLPNHVQQLFLSRLMPGEIWQGHNTPIEAQQRKNVVVHGHRKIPKGHRTDDKANVKFQIEASI